jgi:Holliday junction resolvase RusA-like endonuclease
MRTKRKIQRSRSQQKSLPKDLFALGAWKHSNQNYRRRDRSQRRVVLQEHTLAMMLESITIDMELTSGNSGQQKHWYESHKQRRRIEDILKEIHRKREVPYMTKVALNIVRLYSGRQREWDCDNLLRGNSKQLIDSMVSVGFFLDDSTKYITQVVGSQERSKVSGIRIEIHSKPAAFEY